MRYELSHTKRQLIELVLIFSYFLFASWFAFSVKTGFTEYILIFALPPLVYVLTRLGKYAWKVVAESIILSAIFVFGTDIIAHTSGTWIIKGSLGYKIFSNTFLDNFIWAVLYAGLIIGIYEYFFDRYKSSIFGHKFKGFLIALVSFNIVFVLGSLLTNYFSKNTFDLFYLSIIIPMILITILFLKKLEGARHKILFMGIVVLLPSAIYEWVSLSLGHWTFNSSMYLFMVDFFGHRIPLEEILWFFFLTTSLLCLHETLVDNGK